MVLEPVVKHPVDIEHERKKRFAVLRIESGSRLMLSGSVVFLACLIAICFVSAGAADLMTLAILASLFGFLGFIKARNASREYDSLVDVSAKMNIDDNATEIM